MRPTIALYQPDIAGNTGTILRLSACLGLDLAIIEPAGFDMSDRALKRAGMDYVEMARLTRHLSFAAFEAWRAAAGRRLVLFTTAAATGYTDFAYRPDDVLLFGRESAGVPPHVHAAADARVTIAMVAGARSLNLAVAAGMAAGEALRQVGAPRTPACTTGLPTQAP
ncbi:tRNA (cytidine(34)-2'-O)-methyltransferase [Aureimonas glaciei]|uniref:tRNA (cytidine(34)-2'-O)-methyltransferase n=1 Tax=Aureimonas glaciei TaxID=1776957 RepID=A0A916Y2F1_9HYPH|nr:tRNA (cytidine(34)-2'-O)-methyltransferase [Aureimonas glaciei]GGD28211.1 tRNA (cytidine(34)-2'-O)-methyltransferase [Aureimonas glaciei]